MCSLRSDLGLKAVSVRQPICLPPLQMASNLQASSFNQWLSTASVNREPTSASFIKQNSNEKANSIMSKIDAFEAQFNAYVNSRNKEYNEAKARVSQTQELATAKQEEFCTHLTSKIDEIKARQKAIAQLVVAETDRRAESEKRLKNLIEDKMNEITNLISDQKRLSKNAFGSLDGKFDASFKRLKERVEKLREKFTQSKGAIEAKRAEFFEVLDSELNREIQRKDENEAAIFDLLKSILQNVNSQIESERQARESNVDAMLNLLEETCEKIEMASS